MRLLKFLLVAVLLNVAAHAQYVQPMGYKDYSFWGQMNIGNFGAKATKPGVLLEIGKDTTIYGMLPPRVAAVGVITTPYESMIVYSYQDTALMVYRGDIAGWQKLGAGGSGGGGGDNNYPNSIGFSTGTLTLGRSGLSSLSVSLDGRYTKYSDTASMLTNYKHWGAGYTKNSDTSSMLTNYRHWLAGYLKAADIAGKLNISDTAAMLTNYRHWLADYATIQRLIDTAAALRADFPAGGGGGSDGNNYPNSLAYSADVLTLGRSGLSNLTASLPFSSKLNISDTATMLTTYKHWGAGYTKNSDTSSMLTNYRHWLAGYLKAADIAGKLNISDTAAMLTNYKHWGAGYTKNSDTASMLTNYKHWGAGYTKNSDTAAMLTNYRHWLAGYANNTNTGAGYRILKPGAQEIKTLYHSASLSIDSTTNTNGLTIRTVDVANVKDYGAVGDGTTDNLSAFNSAKATGKAIYIPDGTYYLSASFTLSDDQSLYGNGQTSIIKFTGNSRAVIIGDRSKIHHLKFIGSGKAAGLPFQTGILLYDAIGWEISNCYFSDFSGEPVQNGGGGIFGVSVAAGNSDGGRISECYFDNNNGGLVLAQRAEYITINGCSFGGNTAGMGVGAGNLTIVANVFHENTYGLKFFEGTNDGHSIVSSNLINHNTYPIWIEDIEYGTGLHLADNMIYNGVIKFINSFNVKISGGNIDQIDSIAISNSKAIQMVGVYLGSNPAAAKIPMNIYNGGEPITTIGELRRTASTPNHWIRQVQADTVLFKGPMYHTGITPASSSSSDSVWVKDATTGQYLLRAQSDISGGGGGGGTNTFTELKFKVGTTANAPDPADSVFTYTPFINKKLNVFREGALLFDSSSADGYEFVSATGQITFHPPLEDGEKVIIQAYPSADWSYVGIPTPPSGYDTDADAYFAAVATAGVTLSTGEKDAYNTWVLAEKSASRYSKYTAIYPLMGGTAATHAINAKNPGTNNLTYTGTITHNASGIRTAGTSSDYITAGGLKPSDFGQNNLHFGLYVNDDNSSGYDFGSYSATGVSIGRFSSDIYSSCNTSSTLSAAGSSIAGMNVVTRVLSTEYHYVKAGTVNTQSVTSATASNELFQLGILGGLFANPSTKRYAFMTIGTGLTATEAQGLNATTLTLQTALGRN